MGYDVTMVVGEVGYENGLHEIATLDLKKIGKGPLMKRLMDHEYDPETTYWLYAGPQGEKFSEAYHHATDSTLFSGGGRKPTEVETFVVNELWSDEFRVDNYGEEPKTVPIDEAISLLHGELASDEHPYRRFYMALAILEAAKNGWGDYENLAVVFYGH
tara:strand:- start:79 stop:555 length:477 start_codon:yes stop_codon:yes gene_type:complete